MAHTSVRCRGRTGHDRVMVCSVPIAACLPWQNLRAFKRDCRLLVLLANAIVWCIVAMG